MAARFFVVHHGRPHAVGVEVAAGVIKQRFGPGFQQTRRKTLANQPALAVAPVRIEAVAHHPPPIAKGIGHHRHQAGRHFGKVDVGVANG